MACLAGDVTALRLILPRHVFKGRAHVCFHLIKNIVVKRFKSLIEQDVQRAKFIQRWDPTCPFGYNPLPFKAPEYHPLIASGLIDTLKKQWADAWGARMEHLLRFAILALLERPNSSIADIMPMFLDKDFRESVVQQIQEPAVKDFWIKEFPKMSSKKAPEGIAPIANKLGGFLAHPLVRKAICNPEHPLRFRQIMDEGKILIVNLSKGKLGADVSNILGGLIVSNIGHAAYSRQDIPENERSPFFLYADEFHSFTTSAFAGILSELRKYRLGLVLAHQHTSQVDKSVLEAVLGNVGTLIYFRVGAIDAPIIAKQFGEFNPYNLRRSFSDIAARSRAA